MALSSIGGIPSPRRKKGGLRVFTYNMAAPVEIEAKDAANLAKKLAHHQYDVICIQSVFREDAQTKMANELRIHNYHFLTTDLSKKENTKHNTTLQLGLFFASSMPIIKWEFEQFTTHAKNQDKQKNTVVVKGLLSVLLDLHGSHFWVFSPQFQERKIAGNDPQQSPWFLQYIQRCAKIMHSKIWSEDKQLDQRELTYGSFFQLLYGQKSALYEKPNLTLGGGTRMRDRPQQFKVVRANNSTPPIPVCYGDLIQLLTYNGLSVYASDNRTYSVSSESKGLRGVVSFVDPRYVESTEPIKNNDQFVIRDHTGNYVAVHRGEVFHGKKKIEDATLFRLDVVALVPKLKSVEPEEGAIITTGSQIVFEQVKSTPSRYPLYLSVEPSVNGRWHVHGESLTMGDLETFEIVNPTDFCDVSTVWENDVVYLKSLVGHYLTVDRSSLWVFCDQKKPDQASEFSFRSNNMSRTRDKKVRKRRKNKEEDIYRQSLTGPFNVERIAHLTADFEWNANSLQPERIFTIHEKLGQGSYGSVFRATHVDGYVLAIKVIQSGPKNDDLRNEIDILKKMCHANVVIYFGSVWKEKALWILMEFMALGSIRDMIDSRGSPLTEPELAYVCGMTLRGLHYLHSQGIIHRDIKAANILLNDQAEVKLADFGVSKYFGNISGDETVGTPLWMAPEILKKKPVTFNCDLWSFGITVIEMADGNPPYHDGNVFRAWKFVADPTYPPPTFIDPTKWSRGAVDLVAVCLRKNPVMRPSAYTLLSHAFVKDIFMNQKLREQMLKTLLLVRRMSQRLNFDFPKTEGPGKDVGGKISGTRGLREISPSLLPDPEPETEFDQLDHDDDHNDFDDDTDEDDYEDRRRPSNGEDDRLEFQNEEPDEPAAFYEETRFFRSNSSSTIDFSQRKLPIDGNEREFDPEISDHSSKKKKAMKRANTDNAMIKLARKAFVQKKAGSKIIKGTDVRDSVLTSRDSELIQSNEASERAKRKPTQNIIQNSSKEKQSKSSGIRPKSLSKGQSTRPEENIIKASAENFATNSDKLKGSSKKSKPSKTEKLDKFGLGDKLGSDRWDKLDFRERSDKPPIERLEKVRAISDLDKRLARQKKHNSERSVDKSEKN